MFESEKEVPGNVTIRTVALIVEANSFIKPDTSTDMSGGNSAGFSQWSLTFQHMLQRSISDP
ncbi:MULTISPECIES: hypothetical protein [Prosthecochloris]|uniref:hypothetical protein n=1 Tax=Prosthecochloris TaxID=1101 RepID=UPI001F3A4E2C|nr:MULTISPECIES: hypothetical protein [Prosthecochloris]